MEKAEDPPDFTDDSSLLIPSESTPLELIQHHEQWPDLPNISAHGSATGVTLFSKPSEDLPWSPISAGSDLIDMSRGSIFSAGISALWHQPKLPSTRAFQLVTTQDRATSLSLRQILAQLRSFPMMVLPGSAGPPFVHWRQMHKDPAAPLARCGGLMALWSTMNLSTMPFVCTCIRLDVERLTAEAPQYSDADAVAALQATCAYVLTRASARDEEWFDFDIPLIRHMNKLSCRVQGITMRHCPPNSTVCPAWENWVLVESLRRTLLTIFIMLFTHDLTPVPEVSACNLPHFWSNMLIPSTRQLWEAKSQEQFELAWDLSDHDRRLTIEQLCNHNTLSQRDSRFLDAWLGQVDEFGHLIALVANWVKIVDTTA